MSATRGRSATGSALASFVVTALVVCGVWWWLGAPIQIASPTASVGKPYCLSYAPFRDAQNPLVEGTRVEAAQIEQDLALLSKYTDCIRTYSVDDGRADVLESARRHGLKVLHGIWVSSDPVKTRQQIETTVALAKAYPDVIAAVVVGNEVLLRGEMSSTDLIGYIRQVKAQVPMPVTYADVWEFWLRYPDVQSAVDFVTIHVLPYWEDFPIPATRAAAHVAAIRARVAAAFPGKEIVIGEFGWPSAGRMREERAAIAVQPGTRHSGSDGAGKTRKFPDERHRGVRSAVETRTRRCGRRLLGHHRPRDRRTEIQFRRHGLGSSALGRPGAGWRTVGGPDLRRCVFLPGARRACRHRNG